jgi:hypothetical protein
MGGYKTEYRGYSIIAKRNGRGWVIAVSPKTPELPLMPKSSFDIRAPSSEEAIANIRTRIDLLLDVLL